MRLFNTVSVAPEGLLAPQILLIIFSRQNSTWVTVTAAGSSMCIRWAKAVKNQARPGCGLTHSSGP